MNRIVAANRVVMPDGAMYKPGFVELDGDIVVRTGHLYGELPFTEWLGGTVLVNRDAVGVMHACRNGCILSAHNNCKTQRIK